MELTKSQQRTLDAIRALEPTTFTALGARLDMTRAGAFQNCERLRGMGLITWEPDLGATLRTVRRGIPIEGEIR